MVKILRTLAILISFTGSALAQPSADSVLARAADVLGTLGSTQARYFSFTFIVERDGKVVSSFPQQWDRVSGDYRVSGNDPQGNPFELVMNTNTRKGRATVNGVALTDPGKLADFLNNVGYRRFVNDTFWLLAPLRITEPTTRRSYEGERNDSCGRVWDVVKLTFEGGVLGDVYWAWVNRDTGIIDEWDMRLQSMSADERPTEIVCHDYRRVGGLLVSTTREFRGRSQVIRFGDLQVLTAAPKRAFH